MKDEYRTAQRLLLRVRAMVVVVIIMDRRANNNELLIVLFACLPACLLDVCTLFNCV